jgi:hypothetical protein
MYLASFRKPHEHVAIAEVPMRLHMIQFTKVRDFLSSRPRWRGFFVGLAAVAMISVAGNALFQNPPRNVPDFLNRLPDTNDQARMHQEQQATQKDFEALNARRKKQVSEDTEKLVKLASDLKTEVDKSGSETLSTSAIRKAQAIEKLAHDIKKMAVTAQPN